MTKDKVTTVKSTQPHQWQTRVCLRSNEGFPYEIDRQILIDSSAFFADLFDLPWNLIKDQASATARISNGVNESSNSGDGAVSSVATPLTLDELIVHEVIDIDLSTKDLQLFLGFMQVTARSKFLVRSFSFNNNLEQARLLLSLIDQYECERMRSALYNQLASIAMGHPWEVLQIACKENNLELGRRAICYLFAERLYDFVGSDRTTAGWIGLSKLSDTWKTELIRLLLPGSQKHDTILLMELDSYAYIWCDKFDPEGYQEEVDVNGKRKRV